MPPVILVTTDRRDGGPGSTTPRVRPKRAEAWVSEGVIEAVRRAGGLPLLVPPGPADLTQLLALADGVVVTGGHFDIHPSHYGEAVHGRLDRIEPSRTDLELELARRCLAEGTPILGLCGGHQVLAVAAGGTLVQDIGSQIEGALQHEQPTDPATPWHPVHLEGRAVDWLGGQTIQVNSTHHQAVRDAGSLRISGRAPDGVVEVIEGLGSAFVLGVQWHPELLADDAAFRALVEAASA